MGPVFQALVDQAETADGPEFRTPQKILPMRNGDDGAPRAATGRDSSIHSRERLTPQPSRDLARLAAARTGNPTRAAEFIKDISPIVWKSCSVLVGNGGDAREAFSEVMAAISANRFARLGAYSGRGTLNTFIALVVRELMTERVLRLLQSDPEQGWIAFESLFQSDIHRVIRKRCPQASAEEKRRDLYQDICLALVSDGYRRIKAYGGNGSFGGFVLRTVDHLVIDALRDDLRRRRLPAEVAKLPPLEQELFKLLHWQRVANHPEILGAHLATRLKQLHHNADIEAALTRVRELPPPVITEFASLSSAGVNDVAAPDDCSPEAQMLRADEDRALNAALEVLNHVAANLSGSERLYLTIVLGGQETPPSREIARLMRCPVEDIYKLRQRVLQRLRDMLSDNSSIKSWRASV